MLLLSSLWVKHRWVGARLRVDRKAHQNVGVDRKGCRNVGGPCGAGLYAGKLCAGGLSGGGLAEWCSPRGYGDMTF